MPPKDEAAQGSPGGGGRGGDRLSGLWDQILVRVVSHLKAWEAVRTSLLSKRWRNLWTSASRLDVSQPCLCRGGGDLPARQLRARGKKFAAFVKTLLLRRQQLVPLDSLQLCWSHETVHGDANAWVAHAVRRGAVEIELSGKHHNEYPSPKYMSFIAGDSGAFKIRLKILKLIHVSLDDTTLTQLCSRCTCLKELELKDCLIPQETKIQSILLERLTMIRCQIRKGLSVDAPNLGSLEFSRNFGYVPWIQNLGLLSASNINQRAPQKYPECSGLGSCKLKILKLSRVKLDDSTLAQLYSRCTSLEELELKDCLVVGKEIRSTSLRCLTIISCEFDIESRVDVPNLLSLRCTRPFRQVPWFQNMEFLVTAIIALDDSCMPSDSWWTWAEDDTDESDHDADFFAHSRAEDSDDNREIENEFNVDEEDEYDHDGDFFAHSRAEGSDDYSDNEFNQDEEDESDHDGDYFAHSRAEYSDDKSDNESSQDEEDESDPDGKHSTAEESDDNSDFGSGKSDDNNEDESNINDNIFAHAGAEDSDEVDGRSVGYDEIAAEYNGDCGGMFGGDGMLCSLSNVRTMDLSAHSGEVLLMRELKSCTDFKNLKTLSLGEWCITPDLDVLASILRRSPNLENLFVHLDMANKRRVGFDPRASSFVCTNLKKVEITYCKHDKMIHILAEFFRLNSITRNKILVCHTACTCDVKRDTGSEAKRKAQTEAEKRPAKQIKPGN